MANIQAQLKRAILDEIWNSVPEDHASTLEELIRKFKSGLWFNIKSGSFINSTSSNGNQVSREIPAYVRQLSPDQFFMLGQELLELRDAAITDLGVAGDGSADQAIYDCMQADDSLQTVRELQRDYTTLRYPATGPGIV